VASLPYWTTLGARAPPKDRTQSKKSKRYNVRSRSLSKESFPGDQLYTEEMGNMAREFFPGLEGPPSSNTLGFDDEGSRGDAFDGLIRGWTKYWNDILKPNELLNSNLVKALIASESGFNPKADTKKKGDGRARGLMQITDGTLKILEDEKGELKDHFVNLDEVNAYDPNLNIAAGIRWLFHKKNFATNRLK
jgi:hypothetical protein